LLRPRAGDRDVLARLLDAALGGFFRLFNRAFAAGTEGYARGVGTLLRAHPAGLLAYAALPALTYVVFPGAPTGFTPEQDQGRLIVNVQLPDSASLQRTQAAVAQAEAIARRVPGVAHTVTISGLSFLLSANGSNLASLFIVLDPFEHRRGPGRHADAIM